MKEQSSPKIERILILEDHKDAQLWLKDACLLAFGSQVTIALRETVATAKTFLLEQELDLFLVDLNLPDGSGHETLLLAQSQRPKLICVVTTIYSDDAHIFPALHAGANGYILKDESKENIAEMLRNILNNVPAISNQISQKIISHFHKPPAQKQLSQLTEREQEALRYLSNGLSVKECALAMNISHHTVSGYVKELYRKLNVSSRAELTQEAMRAGMLI